MLPTSGRRGFFDLSLDPNNPMANPVFASPVPTAQPVPGQPIPPVGPSATYTGTTPPVPGLFGGWFSGQDMAGQGPYEPGDYQRARSNMLMSMGASLLAAGQPMTGFQRAQIIQGLPAAAGQYREDLRGGLQDRQAADALQQQKTFDEYSANPENLKSLGFNDSQITLLSKMPRAERTHTIQSALDAQFKPGTDPNWTEVKTSEGVFMVNQKDPTQFRKIGENIPTGSDKADLVTLVGPDGKQQRSFNIADPAQLQEIQKLTQNGWTERQGSSSNVNVNVGDKLTEGQARTIMLWPQMNQANQVLDKLDVQLTDPAGKFAQAGGDWTRWAQTPEYQQADQAANAFTSNYLYATSGATATEQEVQRTKQTFFPQPGDTPNVIAQKKQMRQMALQSMKASLGNQAAAVDQFGQSTPATTTTPGKKVYNPATGRIE